MMTTIMLVLVLVESFTPVALLFCCCRFRHTAARCIVSVAAMMMMVVGSEVTSGCFPLYLVIAALR